MDKEQTSTSIAKSSKRTRHIRLNSMRKAFAIKPLAIGIAGIFLSACADNRQDAEIFTSVEDCTNSYEGFAEVCEATYQQALKEAEEVAPKYNSEADCEHEFGANQCRQESNASGSFFMPLMAGYMIGNMMSRRPYYQPMYTSFSRNNPLRGNWFTADGLKVGDIRKNSFKVKPSAFDKRPVANTTLRRGGFGNKVRASSSYRSSSKGWGG